MSSESESLEEKFKQGVAVVQRRYECRRTELQDELSALERHHAEWLATFDGEKLFRIKIVANLQKAGETETVYSERVKLAARQIARDLEAQADAARKRLAERGYGRMT